MRAPSDRQGAGGTIAPALFDVHVAVDWSAASSPTTGRDSIWTAVRRTVEPDRVELANHRTRRAALAALIRLIDLHRDDRVLIGVDFPLGYPAGVARALGVEPPDRRGLWALLVDLVVDDIDNRNNRFEVGAELNRRLKGGDEALTGPFWGHPAGRFVPDLRPTKPSASSFAEYRAAELVLQHLGLRPFSVWQLAYAGGVGGQTLTGIPAVAALVAARPGRLRVWPFDTGLGGDPTAGLADTVVVAEVWPSAFDVDPRRHPVRDAAQVAHCTAETVAADRRGDLVHWFGPEPADPVAARAEEGWVLGVPGDGAAGLPWRR